MTGPVDNQAALQTYLAALPAAAVTACRLHAGPAELTQRIMTRGEAAVLIAAATGWPGRGPGPHVPHHAT
jgi:hypothetical protein